MALINQINWVSLTNRKEQQKIAHIATEGNILKIIAGSSTLRRDLEDLSIDRGSNPVKGQPTY